MHTKLISKETLQLLKGVDSKLVEGMTAFPAQSALARWLRETHHLHVNVQHNMHYAWQVQLQDIRGYDGTERKSFDEKWLANDYNTYEEALEAGIALALAQLK